MQYFRDPIDPDIVWRRNDNGTADFRYVWSEVWLRGKPSLSDNLADEISEEEGTNQYP
jgi:hypothetical protein